MIWCQDTFHIHFRVSSKTNFARLTFSKNPMTWSSKWPKPSCTCRPVKYSLHSTTRIKERKEYLSVKAITLLYFFRASVLAIRSRGQDTCHHQNTWKLSHTANNTDHPCSYLGNTLYVKLSASSASMPKPCARPFLEVGALSSSYRVSCFANETTNESGAVRSILSAEYLMDSCKSRIHVWVMMDIDIKHKVDLKSNHLQQSIQLKIIIPGISFIELIKNCYQKLLQHVTWKLKLDYLKHIYILTHCQKNIYFSSESYSSVQWKVCVGENTAKG